MTDSLLRRAMPTVAEADEREHDIWAHVQRGLVYPAPHAVFATFWADENGAPLTIGVLRRVVALTRLYIHEQHGDSNTTAVAGVGFRRWARWCAEDGTALPAGMRVLFPASPDEPVVSTVFARSAGTFADSAGDLWFHIKSDGAAHCRGVFDHIAGLLADEGCVDARRTVSQEAASKSPRPDGRGGKVVGSRFSENLNNPTDPVTLRRFAVVGEEDSGHLGASFVLAQRFTINWARVLDHSPQGIEDMVGRTTSDTFIPSREDRSHIRRARVQDDHGDTTPVLRLSLPFGRSPAVADDALRE